MTYDRIGTTPNTWLRLGILLALCYFACGRARAQPAGPTRPAGVEEIFDLLQGIVGPTQARVRLITDNQDAWYARWRMLEEAKRTIDCTYYIIDADIFGRALLGQLYRKAKAGVTVRLMIDARGSPDLARRVNEQSLLRELCTLPNVSIRVYNPVNRALLRVLKDPRLAVASNHDKLLITDGTWLLTGGRNVSADYLTCLADNPRCHADTDILVHGGSAPQRAQFAFAREFESSSNYIVKNTGLFGGHTDRSLDIELARRVMLSHITGDGLPDIVDGKLGEAITPLRNEMARYPHLKGYRAYEPFQGQRTYPIALFDKVSIALTPGKRINEITPALVRLLDSCRDEILVQNPYVVLTRTCREAFKRAAARGVRIVIHTNSPESCDTFVTQALFVNEWKHYLRDYPTMRIFVEHGQNLLHSKVFVLDRKVTVVGSYNMDDVSESINSEEVAVIRSPEFSRMTALRIERALAGALEYKIQVRPDGGLKQLTGPSDHCVKSNVSLLALLGNVMHFVGGLF